MLLNNPKQQRGLSEASRPDVTERANAYLRDFVRQTQRDAEIVESVCRVLEHPAYQRLADKLRKLIKG